MPSVLPQTGRQFLQETNADPTAPLVEVTTADPFVFAGDQLVPVLPSYCNL